jgi:hypothetical protein
MAVSLNDEGAVSFGNPSGQAALLQLFFDCGPQPPSAARKCSSSEPFFIDERS